MALAVRQRQRVPECQGGPPGDDTGQRRLNDLLLYSERAHRGQGISPFREPTQQQSDTPPEPSNEELGLAQAGALAIALGVKSGKMRKDGRLGSQLFCTHLRLSSLTIEKRDRAPRFDVLTFLEMTPVLPAPSRLPPPLQSRD